MEQSKYELNLIEDPFLPIRAGRGYGVMKITPTVNWHENIEILYCTSGVGYVKKNGESFLFKAGDIIVVNSEEVHSVHRDPFGLYHCIIIDRHFCAECGIPSTSLIFQSRIRDQKLAEVYLHIHDAYDRYIQTGAPHEILAIRALTLDFLCRLCKDYLICEKSDNAQKRNDAIKTAVTYIREHLSEPITMESLTQLTGVSESTLSRRFKHAFGRSVVDTIHLLRCTEAKRLLEKGSSVAETARACGFLSTSHFTHTFKRQYGEPPTRYLQKK